MKANPLEMGYDFFVVGDPIFEVYPQRHCPSEYPDLFTPDDVRCSLILRPMETHLFHLGIKTAIQPGYGCLFWDRSGMGGKKLIHRFAGVIDSTWRGEWLVRLFNFDDVPHIIHEGDRIVQGIFQQMIMVRWHEVSELPESFRGDEGFGSTGR